MTLPDCLPRTELLPWQIAPRDPCAEPIGDAFDDATAITERVTAPPTVRRQQRLDPLPLLVREPRNREPVDLTHSDCREPHHRYGRHALADFLIAIADEPSSGRSVSAG
jgi:hypothetical protein